MDIKASKILLACVYSLFMTHAYSVAIDQERSLRIERAASEKELGNKHRNAESTASDPLEIAVPVLHFLHKRSDSGENLDDVAQLMGVRSGQGIAKRLGKWRNNLIRRLLPHRRPNSQPETPPYRRLSSASSSQNSVEDVSREEDNDNPRERARPVLPNVPEEDDGMVLDFSPDPGPHHMYLDFTDNTQRRKQRIRSRYPPRN